MEDRDEPQLVAEIKSVQCSLNISRGRYDEAIRLNSEAFKLYSRSANPLGEARVRVSRGIIYHAAGLPKRAFAPTVAALRVAKMLDAEELRLLIYMNLIVFASDIDDLASAGLWLGSARPLFAEASSRIRQQFDWVEGVYLVASGSYREAREKLKGLRSQFSSLNMLGHLSTVSLDLARIELRLGNRSEARAFLECVLDICGSLDIEHQRKEALALLED
jgi:tetratricopeptide (TPR) repeat protein